jgi:hypothetical protein
MHVTEQNPALKPWKGIFMQHRSGFQRMDADPGVPCFLP